MQMGFPPGHFTHVLIDEAGQCTEPEAMVAICQVSQTRGQVVLSGDPQQLERILERTPYTKDLLRFPDTSGFDPRLVTKLLYNYRALPSILNVYNELFYDSELLPMVDEQNSRKAELLERLDVLLPPSETRPRTHGAFFNGTRSENKQESDSPSWFNAAEAKNVRRHKLKFSSTSTNILYFVKQVKRIRNLYIEANIAMPKIGSVEEFQGQERDII